MGMTTFKARIFTDSRLSSVSQLKSRKRKILPAGQSPLGGASPAKISKFMDFYVFKHYHGRLTKETIYNIVDPLL